MNHDFFWLWVRAGVWIFYRGGMPRLVIHRRGSWRRDRPLSMSYELEQVTGLPLRIIRSVPTGSTIRTYIREIDHTGTEG